MSARQLTAADFHKWEKTNGPAIEAECERNHSAVLDEVVRLAMEGRQVGRSLDEIGDLLLVSFNYGKRNGVIRLPMGVERALREIGWRPKRERAPGSSE